MRLSLESKNFNDKYAILLQNHTFPNFLYYAFTQQQHFVTIRAYYEYHDAYNLNN